MPQPLTCRGIETHKNALSPVQSTHKHLLHRHRRRGVTSRSDLHAPFDVGCGGQIDCPVALSLAPREGLGKIRLGRNHILPVRTAPLRPVIRSSGPKAQWASKKKNTRPGDSKHHAKTHGKPRLRWNAQIILLHEHATHAPMLRFAHASGKSAESVLPGLPFRESFCRTHFINLPFSAIGKHKTE